MDEEGDYPGAKWIRRCEEEELSGKVTRVPPCKQGPNPLTHQKASYSCKLSKNRFNNPQRSSEPGFCPGYTANLKKMGFSPKFKNPNKYADLSQHSVSSSENYVGSSSIKQSYIFFLELTIPNGCGQRVESPLCQSDL